MPEVEVRIVIEHQLYNTVKHANIHRFTCVVEIGGVKMRTNAISKQSARKLQRLGLEMRNK